MNEKELNEIEIAKAEKELKKLKDRLIFASFEIGELNLEKVQLENEIGGLEDYIDHLKSRKG